MSKEVNLLNIGKSQEQTTTNKTEQSTKKEGISLFDSLLVKNSKKDETSSKENITEKKENSSFNKELNNKDKTESTNNTHLEKDKKTTKNETSIKNESQSKLESENLEKNNSKDTAVQNSEKETSKDKATKTTSSLLDRMILDANKRINEKNSLKDEKDIKQTQKSLFDKITEDKKVDKDKKTDEKELNTDNKKEVIKDNTKNSAVDSDNKSKNSDIKISEETSKNIEEVSANKDNKKNSESTKIVQEQVIDEGNKKNNSTNDKLAENKEFKKTPSSSIEEKDEKITNISNLKEDKSETKDKLNSSNKDIGNIVENSSEKEDKKVESKKESQPTEVKKEEIKSSDKTISDEKKLDSNKVELNKNEKVVDSSKVETVKNEEQKVSSLDEKATTKESKLDKVDNQKVEKQENIATKEEVKTKPSSESNVLKEEVKQNNDTSKSTSTTNTNTTIETKKDGGNLKNLDKDSLVQNEQKVNIDNSLKESDPNKKESKQVKEKSLMDQLMKSNETKTVSSLEVDSIKTDQSVTQNKNSDLLTNIYLGSQKNSIYNQMLSSKSEAVKTVKEAKSISDVKKGADKLELNAKDLSVSKEDASISSISKEDLNKQVEQKVQRESIDRMILDQNTRKIAKIEAASSLNSQNSQPQETTVNLNVSPTLALSIQNRIIGAQQQMSSMMSDIARNMYENYKPPVTAFRINLFPAQLGQIAILMKSERDGSGISISMNMSNQSTLEAFVESQASLREAINRNFNNETEVNFEFGMQSENQSNSSSSDEQEKQKQHQQHSSSDILKALNENKEVADDLNYM